MCMHLKNIGVTEILCSEITKLNMERHMKHVAWVSRHRDTQTCRHMHMQTHTGYTDTQTCSHKYRCMHVNVHAHTHGERKREAGRERHIDTCLLRHTDTYIYPDTQTRIYTHVYI